MSSFRYTFRDYLIRKFSIKVSVFGYYDPAFEDFRESLWLTPRQVSEIVDSLSPYSKIFKQYASKHVPIKSRDRKEVQLEQLYQDLDLRISQIIPDSAWDKMLGLIAEYVNNYQLYRHHPIQQSLAAIQAEIEKVLPPRFWVSDENQTEIDRGLIKTLHALIKTRMTHYESLLRSNQKRKILNSLVEHDCISFDLGKGSMVGIVSRVGPDHDSVEVLTPQGERVAVDFQSFDKKIMGVSEIFDTLQTHAVPKRGWECAVFIGKRDSRTEGSNQDVASENGDDDFDDYDDDDNEG